MTRNEHASRKNRESLTKRLGKVGLMIRERDGHACQYCGATEASSGAKLHLDHLLPRSAGGADVAGNLVVACRSCNSARHDMPLTRWCRQIGVDVRRIRRAAARPLPTTVAA